MNRKIFIHIGAHKTGTTSLQNFFHNNRDKLLAQGVLYPESCHFLYAQHRLAFAAKGMSDPAKGDIPGLDIELQALRNEIENSSAPVTIVSSEEFFTMNGPAIEKIAAGLAGFTVEIVAVIRRPDELFCSIFNQMQKDPRNVFKVHYSRFLHNPISLSGDLEFDASLERWASVFGREHVLVDCYESKPDSVSLVCSLMGLTIDGEAAGNVKSMNHSMSVKALEVMRLAKHAGFDEPTRHRLFEISSRLLKPPRGRAESLLAPMERIALLKRMDPITDRVFEAFLKRRNIYNSALFEESMFPPKSILTIRDTIELLGKLVQAKV